MPIKEKIETIARDVYGADGVDYSPEAEERIAEYTRLGFDNLPHLHGQDSPEHQPRPEPQRRAESFRLPIRTSRLGRAPVSCTLCGEDEHNARPATRPAFFDIDIDLESGRILGLS